MASLIKGISVTLYTRIKAGSDAFGAPIYEETPETIENVLVTPVNASDIVGTLQLHGTRIECELCIPKGDTHHWDGCKVNFWDKEWRVFAPATEQIEALVPLMWNKKVRVERYG